MITPMYNVPPTSLTTKFRRDRYTDVRQTLKRLGMDTKVGDIVSDGFVQGVSGWRIAANGDVEFNNGVFRGTFSIGGTIITIDNTQDLQGYLDLLEAEGGGILYLQNGTYTLSANIDIPSGVTVQGVSRDDVIIDGDGSFGLRIIGSNSYNTGTVTISNGDTEVVGTGTTWTAGMVGEHILLDRIWYGISAFTDSTHIDISTPYSNDDLSGAAYTIATINFDTTISNLTVTNTTGAGIKAQYAMEPRLEDVVVYGCGIGIDLDQVVYPRMVVTSVDNGVNLDMTDVGGFYIDFSLFGTSTTGAGVKMTNSGDATFFNSSITGNTGNGLEVTGCNRIEFSSITVNLNGGNGVEFISNCDNNQLANMIIDANTGDGVKLTATTDLITFQGLSLSNNSGYAMNIANANCDNNILIGCKAQNNTSGSISDSGTGTLKSTAVNVLP